MPQARTLAYVWQQRSTAYLALSSAPRRRDHWPRMTTCVESISCSTHDVKYLIFLPEYFFVLQSATDQASPKTKMEPSCSHPTACLLSRCLPCISKQTNHLFGPFPGPVFAVSNSFVVFYPHTFCVMQSPVIIPFGPLPVLVKSTETSALDTHP